MAGTFDHERYCKFSTLFIRSASYQKCLQMVPDYLFVSGLAETTRGVMKRCSYIHLFITVLWLQPWRGFGITQWSLEVIRWGHLTSNLQWEDLTLHYRTVITRYLPVTRSGYDTCAWPYHTGRHINTNRYPARIPSHATKRSSAKPYVMH